ncbi:predicted protein [Naegleria gruberi]|uniref:Predicted protein n=1 Tax=Naegleria gruberi TaxID=5762 RepID=D2VVP2_NAEGR|nr:uncharacterized protein NAEGRDRAFT_73089 [Naegleria gruberi]EFC39075.1 predicted protein [Naegleria gruberi]|eukprot:XP_002671819.1 predicted protein [Naegleria gruberi strain NEG-M]
MASSPEIVEVVDSSSTIDNSEQKSSLIPSTDHNSWLTPVSINQLLHKAQQEKEEEENKEENTDPKKKKKKIRWYHTKCFIYFAAIILAAISILTIIISYVLFVRHNHLLFVCNSAEFIVVSFFEVIILICAAIVAFKLNEWYKQHHSEVAESDEDLKLKYSDNLARDKLIMKFQNTSVVISLCLLTIFTLIYLALFVILLYGISKTTPSLSGVEYYTPIQHETVIEKEKTSGVFHIHAKTDYELFFAQGVVTAKERLFQMEIMRRMGRGTLSALIGEDALELDKWSRTLGLLRNSKNHLQDLDYRANLTLTAFFDGVNSYLKTNPKMPPEYWLIFNKKTIHKFEVVDALVFWKLAALDISTNIFMEKVRFNSLRKNNTLAHTMEFYPTYPRSWPEQFKKTDLNIQATQEEIDALEERFTNNFGAFMPKNEQSDNDNNNDGDGDIVPEDPEDPIVQEGFTRKLRKIKKNHPAVYNSIESFFNKKSHESYFASNAWAVHGSKTKNGKPILANDPHMKLTAPLPFIMFHLVSEESGLDTIGATYPLIPGIVIGRNKNSSWAITSSGSDVQDLFVLDQISDSTYVVNGTEHDYVTHQEEIHFDNTQSVTIHVKDSIYGPVVNTLLGWEDIQEVVALSWTGIKDNDTSLNAVIGIMYQNNWPQFHENMRHLVSPPMNYIYTDAENICSLVAGMVPIRKYGHTGLFPVSGNGTFDYEGYVPYEKMPYVCNPERKFVVAANARIEPPGYPYYLGADVGTKYRLERIEDLLSSNKTFNITNMVDIQLDTYSKLFFDLKPFISKLKNTSLTFQEEVIRKDLEKWDGYLILGSKQASLFEMFHTKLWNMSYADLGVENSNIIYIKNALNKTGRCSPNLPKTCMSYAVSAFKQSIADLKVLSKSTEIPSWGVGIHSTTYFHPVFHSYAFSCACDKRHYVPGGTDTINFSRVTETNLDSSHGVAFRQITSMSDADGDLFITPLGQSANWLDYDYHSNLQIFAEGRYHSLKRKNYKVTSTLTLKPKVSQ